MEGKKSLRAKREEEILAQWEKDGIFTQTLKKPSPKGDFVFFEGPPTANALPGIHHLEARAFKDVIPRFKTMQGYHVRRKAGWDTHGLPVEIAVEKELGLKNKKEIEEYGVGAFNKKCRESVVRFIGEWNKFTTRIAFWVDQDDPYFTFNAPYMESVWWILARAWKKGLVYKDYKVVPWCPRCGTGLSSHELAQGYQDVEDTSVYVLFKTGANEYILAWTTTPWTLPGNVALAVGENIEYVKVSHGGKDIWLAKAKAEELFPGEKIQQTVSGNNLVGKVYEPLFPYLKDSLPKDEQDKLSNAYKVYAADFVSTEEGSGIVHTAVMYGQDDFEFGNKIGLPKHHLVNEEGKFTEDVKDFADVFVKDADEKIVEDLKKRGLLLKEQQITHTYPFCWRCNTPLIYYARDSWYIAMSWLRSKLIKQNNRIHWEPEHIKEGRFGEWLRELKDWAISRSRYWGTPLPIWECADCGKQEMIESVDELKQKTKKSGNRYFVMRHAEDEHNVLGTLSFDEKKPSHLTANGKKDAEEKAKQLKKEKFDLIFSSPLQRAKETAMIVNQCLKLPKKNFLFDDRIREIDTGDFKGKKVEEYWKYFDNEKEKITKRAPNGENMRDVKIRTGEFIYELEKKYTGKNILIVSHDDALWGLTAAAKAATDDETLEIDGPDGLFIENGEVRELSFIPLPHNEDYELDLHRPYVDNVALSCSCGKDMRRVPEVIDVWFDSGAMPFAQDHYPFENKRFVHKHYPADFISEAIDQTRGWFYTLHAIGMLVRKKRAFNNVISLGHILDKKGKKMSKSIGNVVDPWLMLDKYGADALRLWMYGVNQPGEAKNFDESGVDEIVKRTLQILDNVVKFYELYEEEILEDFVESESENVLDRWIVARLNELVSLTTESLDTYRVLEPARAFRNFVTDLSTWYVRRSRNRFKSDDSNDRSQALVTTKYVLSTLSKVMAPMAPFVAEDIYKRVGGNMESVHLEEWPSKEKVDKDVLTDMAEVRETVSRALESRIQEGIKVRQPLARLTIRKKESPLRENMELRDIVAQEVNVKEVIFEESTGWDVELDTELTPELKAEGELREFVRNVQGMRKRHGLAPSDSIILEINANEVGTKFLEKHKQEIQKATTTTSIVFGGEGGEEVKTDSYAFSIKLKKE